MQTHAQLQSRQTNLHVLILSFPLKHSIAQVYFTLKLHRCMTNSNSNRQHLFASTSISGKPQVCIIYTELY